MTFTEFIDKLENNLIPTNTLIVFKDNENPHWYATVHSNKIYILLSPFGTLRVLKTGGISAAIKDIKERGTDYDFIAVRRSYRADNSRYSFDLLHQTLLKPKTGCGNTKT